VNEKEHIESWERVANLLSSEEVATSDELRADLEREGIDVGKSVQSLRTMIRQHYQARLRETANAERAASHETLQLTVAEIAAWPLEKLRQWLGEAEGGRFGTEVAGLTLGYHRNKEDKAATEAELRSLVADIIASKK
jgi:hypothetical protein